MRRDQSPGPWVYDNRYEYNIQVPSLLITTVTVMLLYYGFTVTVTHYGDIDGDIDGY